MENKGPILYSSFISIYVVRWLCPVCYYRTPVKLNLHYTDDAGSQGNPLFWVD
jgi:hypothetical protein